MSLKKLKPKEIKIPNMPWLWTWNPKNLLGIWLGRLRPGPKRRIVRQGSQALIGLTTIWMSIFVGVHAWALARVEEAPSSQSSLTFPFKVVAERFADVQLLRFQVRGFEALPLAKKKLLYYLYEAALSGREITYDQKYRYNLTVKRTLEEILAHYPGARDTTSFQNLLIYLKRVWFSSGIHHHVSYRKFTPDLEFEMFVSYVKACKNATFPLRPGQSLDDFLEELKPVIFDPSYDAIMLNQDKNVDQIKKSASNFYVNLSREEVEEYYEKISDPLEEHPPSYGLNSRLIKKDGKIQEQVWRVGGLYSEAITQIVYWLGKAALVAETLPQKRALDRLVRFYRSGDLRDFDRYTMAWLKDTDSEIDVINGFLESHNDALGYRGSFESVVYIRDPPATERIQKLAQNAQWFEDNSPLYPEHKKKNVVGILGSGINVVVSSGEASPSSQIGKNLPNLDWIRKEHGSKSTTYINIMSAQNEAKSAFRKEFILTKDELDRSLKYENESRFLLIDMHEVLGHASGQINKGVGTPWETLKGYAGVLEEARSDLFALYYIMDEKLIELGIVPDLEVGKALYDRFIRYSLLIQLGMVEFGHDIEEYHMRNYHLIASWAYEKGRSDRIIERVTRNNKTYFVIFDYLKLREIFAELLVECQRIKSEGDYEAAKHLVETYGVKLEPNLHREVLDRWERLDFPPYSGFINPKLIPIYEEDEIIDVKIEYPDDFMTQMLEYTQKYAFLPSWN